MAIDLPDATKLELASSIRRYFLEEREEEIGDLQARFFLDFVLKEIGPSIYNQAITDAQASLRNAVADLDTLHELEFGHTTERRSRSNAARRTR